MLTSKEVVGEQQGKEVNMTKKKGKTLTMVHCIPMRLQNPETQAMTLKLSWVHLTRQTFKGKRAIILKSPSWFAGAFWHGGLGLTTYPGVEGQHLRVIGIYYRRIWLENDDFSRRFQCRSTHGHE